VREHIPADGKVYFLDDYSMAGVLTRVPNPPATPRAILAMQAVFRDPEKPPEGTSPYGMTTLAWGRVFRAEMERDPPPWLVRKQAIDDELTPWVQRALRRGRELRRLHRVEARCRSRAPDERFGPAAADRDQHVRSRRCSRCCSQLIAICRLQVLSRSWGTTRARGCTSRTAARRSDAVHRRVGQQAAADLLDRDGVPRDRRAARARCSWPRSA
jgi:hypothetical protein